MSSIINIKYALPSLYLTTLFLQMIKFAQDVETELRTQIIQAREVKPGVYGMISVFFYLNNNYNIFSRS